MTMLDTVKSPRQLAAILEDTAAAGFMLASEPLVGSLLRTLVSTKPGGNILEIGTGTGVGTCWLLDGMDAAATLTTIDRDPATSTIAQRHLGDDPRVTFKVDDAEAVLMGLTTERFDLIFADTFPGKFQRLSEALDHLAVGGLYVVDDLLPQPGWPENHQPNVDRLLAELESRQDLRLTGLAWASGVLIAAKVGG